MIFPFLLWVPLVASYVLPDSSMLLKGNNDINISIVKRDQFTKPEAGLFKKLYFQNLVSAFSFSGDGDEQQQDPDCYDDTLPTNIIIHKNTRCKESDKEFVDNLRECSKGMGDQKVSYSIVDEKDLFAYSNDITEQEAIEIQALQKKIIRNSVTQFLDKFNDLVYVVNGTELSLA